MTRSDVVDVLLDGRGCTPVRGTATQFAPANIALCKYWGKRDRELNLPVASSLSVSLGVLGSRVTLSCRDGGDRVRLNGDVLGADTAFHVRTCAYLDLLCGATRSPLDVEATNTIPTAAGFASSASGFAALAKAVNALMDWGLDDVALSILARLGSGSACRSLHDGFVCWEAGSRADGMDSYGVPVPVAWREFKLGLVVVESGPKATGSREGMLHTQETSPLYGGWLDLVTRDMVSVRDAIARRDFGLLGVAAEGNAMAMHATMLASRPSLCYWIPGTVEVLRRLWQARSGGLEIYATMDAGPNVKVLFLEKDEKELRSLFEGVLVVDPWLERPERESTNEV